MVSSILNGMDLLLTSCLRFQTQRRKERDPWLTY